LLTKKGKLKREAPRSALSRGEGEKQRTKQIRDGKAKRKSSDLASANVTAKKTVTKGGVQKEVGTKKKKKSPRKKGEPNIYAANNFL